jgi:hypothetical protein
MSRIGKKSWAIAGGHIPLRSTGPEPEFTSFDAICVLNAMEQSAAIELTIFYGDRDPCGPYAVSVAARRVRHIRINDLIDPLAVPLDEPYAILLESDVPVVVQFTRQDTRQAENAVMGLMAFPID